MNENVHPIFRQLLNSVAPQPEPRKPPYPEFCSHPEKCVEAGRCARTAVGGEPWSCAE